MVGHCIHRGMVTALLLTIVCLAAQAQTVSKEEATNRALGFFNSGSLRNGRKMATKQNLVLSHTASAGSETYFYVFNKAGGGWVIVGGDEVCHEILAYSETGSFNYDSAPSNALNWLSGYEAEISHAIAATTEPDGSRHVKKAVYATAGYTTIQPLIQTHWDQEAPYWNMCPSDSKGTCLTGCVATAMAQVMYFWQWPITGTGSKTYKDSSGCKKTLSTTFSDHTYDWTNMQLETDDYKTTAQKNAVAQLMYDCGVSVEMEYTSEGSGAYSENIPTALTSYFGYASTAEYVQKSSYSGDWVKLIYDELAAGRPVLYAGDDTNGNGGHQFVCDGYEYSGKSHTFHFNWGWSGDEDGFFALSSLGKTYNFSKYQDAVIGIKPKEMKIYTVTLADDDTELKPSVAGGSVTLPVRSLPGYTFEGWADNGGIGEPTTTKPTLIAAGSYTPTKDVELYPIFSYMKKGEAGSGTTVLLSEDFASLKTGSNTDTSKQSSSTWNGNDNIVTTSYAYPAAGALKLGSKNNNGSITTKSIAALVGTKMTVSVDVKGWATHEGDININVDGCGSQTFSYTSKISDSFETLTATFTTESANPQVTIATTAKRAFIDNLIVSSGSGTPDTTYYCSYLTPAVVELKVTPAKWATFFAPDDVKLEPGVYAYAVTGDASGIQRELVAFGDAPTDAERTIPAHTPVIVYKDVSSNYSKTYDTFFSVTPSPFTENCLVGTLVDIPRIAATDEDQTNYVLQLNSKGKPAWFSVVYDEENEKFNSLAAYHAYLSLPAGSEAKDIFSEAVTGVTAATPHSSDSYSGPNYNLQGQAVDGSYRGIIIRNGRKILRK